MNVPKLGEITEKEINLEFPKISDIKKEEIAEKSKDKSLGYFWGVSEDIYPYFRNHKFENPITYERPANNFVLKVDYFFDNKEDVNLNSMSGIITEKLKLLEKFLWINLKKLKISYQKK
ncbi:hypothetical protein [Chryseobacterium shandongense]|uniref:hypothetical protein n=1 Tax=Chryseobacterium shandongense TaxID=1493872 RepID=UPI001E41E5B9|nr:hypothetical protein [Chryseobacterium shandongense]